MTRPTPNARTKPVWCIHGVGSDKPDFASVDEAICAALPLLMPFIKRAYHAMKERERATREAPGSATPRPAPRQPRGKRKQ